MDNTNSFLSKCIAGGTCTTISHSLTVPIDVIKTRVQIDPKKYGPGLLQAARVILRTEGVSTLTLGLTPTFSGYFIQGACKFAFFDVIRENLSSRFPNAPLFPLYMGSAACAELIASTFLAPFEAVRIRMVAGEAKGRGAVSFATSIISKEGVSSLFRGLPPILAKQLPYTVVQLATFTALIDAIFGGKKREGISGLAISGAAGIVAGAVSAVASHPPDTMLTRVNVNRGETLAQAARSLGWKGMWAGLGPRVAHIAAVSAGMFLINDTVRILLGLPPSQGSKGAHH